MRDGGSGERPGETWVKSKTFVLFCQGLAGKNWEGVQTSEVSKTSEALAAEASRRVSLAMLKLGISYTKAINKRFARTGALFQGQFRGKPSLRSCDHHPCAW